ncbi:MAG: response regulator transcription factor [Kiritimatiellae bacterium]|nr:response regulator transcription factor [Kiritimatiellia bacterium]MBP5319573.1 response regulator transcription factor [Kiritimatiellia bacterium]
MKTDKIVVIEDDPAIRRVIGLALKTAGYETVLEEDDGRNGLATVLQERPDLVLLDLMLPGLDGLAVCRHIRANPDTGQVPIIMLTAKSEDADIVAGLDAGANDYVTKPFSIEVLLARIRAMLRRPSSGQTQTLELDGLVIDDATHRVTLDGQPVSLTLSEYRILGLLVRHRHRVFTRGIIIERISEEQKVVTDRTVDVQMVNLRRKLGAWASHVETIRGVGYRVS